METIKVGSAVKIEWPDARWNNLHGKVGVVIEKRGRIRRSLDNSVDELWGVEVEGAVRTQILGESHLVLLRPDLEQYIHSTRFALTASDVVYDHLHRQRY